MKYQQGKHPNSRNGFRKGHIGYMGMLGKKQTQKSKNKIKLANIGKKLSKEHKQKIGLALKGKKYNRQKPAWNKGKKISGKQIEEKRQIILELYRKGIKMGFQKGRIVTEEIRKKISEGNKGRISPKYWTGKKFLEEHKRKIGLKLKGRKISEEQKQAIRKARAKQVIPFKDTSIEVKLQNWLKSQNVEFQTHYPILGQPDIFIKPNICIFADGCYWHKCPTCGFGEVTERDKEVTKKLQEQGYTVIRLWEHEINQNIEECFNKIKSFN